MNCVEFRRLSLTHNKPPESGYWDHRKSCPGCRAHHARVQHLNTALERALALPVPPELASRIKLRQSFTRRRPQGAAFAAAILATVVGLGVWFNQATMTPLQKAVLAHAMEPHVPAVSDPVPAQQLAQLMAELGGRFSGAGNFRVFYAKRCRIAGHYAAHLLMDTAQGPVTVFVMPKSTTARELSYQEGHVVTRILPVQRGSIGLVAPQQIDLEPVAREISASLRWEA